MKGLLELLSGKTLSKDNDIHPTAILHPDVIMGSGNFIGPFCIIGPNVRMGDNNRLESHVAVGGPAQHRTAEPSENLIYIGSGNVFREFVTVNSPTTGVTSIADSCYFMACSHISHDTVIDSKVTMANNVLLGGHSRVLQGATLGLGTIVHQYSVIGAYSMLGMGSVVTKKSLIETGKKYAGNPVKLIGDNTVGLQRSGLNEEEMDALKNTFAFLTSTRK